MVWIGIGSLTPFGLQVKLSESYIPTLINGITASTSVVIGIFIAVLESWFVILLKKRILRLKSFI